jgi:hypothetical protein
MADKENTFLNLDCGECTACCRELIIDVPGLTKHAGALCTNCISAKGCTIYDDRPQACRQFLCGWRQLSLSENWRPDRCGIIVMQEAEDRDAGVTCGWKFFLFGGLDKIFWQPFVTFVSSLIAADRTVYISIPGTPGYCSQMMAITPEPELKDAIAKSNYATVVGIIAALVQSCLNTPATPVVFRNPEGQSCERRNGTSAVAYDGAFASRG